MAERHIFYARSANKNGNKETVAHHLQLAAELASEYAEGFGESGNARCAALFHDIGKYTEKFEEVLAGRRKGVNHAAVGAVIMKKYAVVSCIIYAHHSELNWGVKPLLDDIWDGRDVDEDGRDIAAAGKEEISECLKRLRAENDICLPEPVKWISNENDRFRFNLERMLYTRMLYSCLVDADYTSSASHFDPGYLEKCRYEKADFEAKFGSLERYVADIRARSTSNTTINRARDRLYADCVSAAERKPGMFTLTAPTGTGKTLALLAFALKHAAIWNKKRIIIVLPFLSIIEQNAAIYKAICDNVFEQHSATDYHSAQGDEMLRIYADRWNADIIITTSVNFFEGLFKNRASDCRRLHNIAESVIVFDEAQSLPVKLITSSVCTLTCLCDKYRCSVVLSTATQPSFGYRRGIKWSPTEIVRGQSELFSAMNRLNVIWDVDKPTDFEDIALRMSKSGSCCAIVNLKAHCAKLSGLLRELCGDDSVFTISTNMCTAHRRDVLKEIRTRLEKGLACRIVSTQCIEAGVDLDVEEMYRALAPLEAIIQSGGRCNRNGNSEYGKLTVFIPNEEKLYPDESYEIASTKVQVLLARHGGFVDISDVAMIEEYYEMLFTDESDDSEKLVSAVDGMNFEDANKYFKFIKNDGVNVIVPYLPRREQYDELTERIRVEGITPELMRRARGITVTSYEFDKAKDVCENAFKRVCFDGHRAKAATNWYILCEDNMYDEEGINIKPDEISFFV